MKPNKTLFGAFVISVTLIIGACQQTELSDSAPTPSLPALAAEFVADDSDLSAGDAAAVARIFPQRQPSDPCRQRCSRPQRRDDPRRSRASGNPMRSTCKRGLPAGAATKRCYPILAQIDRGTFTLDREPSGLDVVLAGDDRDDRGRTRLRRRLRLPLRMASLRRAHPPRTGTNANDRRRVLRHPERMVWKMVRGRGRHVPFGLQTG